MKAILRTILCLWAIWWTAVVGVAQPPSAGRVLILDNHRILEGDIERVGEQYRIRRATGETWLPAAKARVLCRSMEEAYMYLREGANLEDPDERLRLAHWCRLNNLPDQALHEATSSLKLRPSHEATQRLVRILERREPVKPEVVPAAAVDAEPPPPVDFNSETLGLFVTKVQPILMNTCANCHCGARGNAFKLTRSYADTQANPRAIRYNLAAVLAQVRRDQPSESPLLSWAVTVHGQADKAPIKDRQAPAYRALEEWVKLAVKGATARAEPPSMPEVRLKSQPIRKAEPFAVSTPLEPETTPIPETKSVPVETVAPARKPVEAAEPVVTPVPKPVQVAEPGVPLDPFDPAIFNQQNPKK